MRVDKRELFSDFRLARRNYRVAILRIDSSQTDIAVLGTTFRPLKT